MKNLSGFFLLLIVLVPSLLGISSGQLAPDFAAKNQIGKTVHLSDYKGKFVLVYFYPKDETPGCTKEACSFRDEHAKIKKMNAVVLGISRQDQKSHQEFIAAHKLPFDLLVDSDGSIARSFGVESLPDAGFTKRESVLIGPDGKVVHFYENVDPANHVQQVLGDLEKAAHG